MTDVTQDCLAAALEAIYDSLARDNEGIDAAISGLKKEMLARGLKEAVLDASRLAQNNRQGRKLLIAYFRQRGVKVGFLGA